MRCFSAGALVSLIMLMTWHPGKAQNNNQMPTVIPPSPNAAAFSKYGNIPVSPYTGVPDIEVPLYTIKVRDITVPVSLSYHASGIKVAEEASRVGLGWVLKCGGMISRNIVNHDDFLEQPQGYLNAFNTSPPLPLGPGYTPVFNPQAGGSIQYYNTGADPAGPTGPFTLDLAAYTFSEDFDFQPDQFNYTFAGQSGKFVLTRNREAVIEKNAKLKIRPLTTNVATWEAITADGYTYKFDAHEYFVDHNNTSGYRQISAWYLTRIISPQGEEVTFHYEQTPEQYIRTVGSYREMISPVTLSCAGFSCSPMPVPQASVVPGKSYSNIYLSSVEWKHGKLKFNYADDRQDVAGDKRLVSIHILEPGSETPQQEIAFNHDYFVSDQIGNTYPADAESTDYLTRRLKLLSVIKRPVPDTRSQREEYSFSYYEGTGLPPKNSFGCDHWGYYNGRSTNQSFIPSYAVTPNATSYADIIGVMDPQREPLTEIYTQAFSLESITYPTKGKTSFTYENNTYHQPINPGGGQGYEPQPCTKTSQMFCGGDKKGTVYSQTLDLTDMYVSSSGSTVAVKLKAAFRANKPCKDVTGNPGVYFELYSSSGMKISHVDPGLPSCESNTTPCIQCDRSPGAQSPVFTFSNTYNLSPGVYTWKAFIPSNETQIEDISAMYTWTAKPSACGFSSSKKEHFKKAGGLRIARIEDYAPEGEQEVNIREYEYGYSEVKDDITHIYSYGRRMVRPSYSYFELGAQRFTPDPNIPGSGGGGNDEICLSCIYLVRTSNGNYPPFNAQGYAVGYDKVIERLGTLGEYGRTEYEYENREDEERIDHYANGAPMRPNPYSTRAYMFNGLLKKRTDYNWRGDRVKEVTNTYSVIKGTIVYGVDKAQIRKVSLPSDQNDLLLRPYQSLASNYIYLSESVEKNFETNIAGTEIRSKFYYTNPAHLQLTKKTTLKSDGQVAITEYKYPADYSDAQAGSVVLAMKGDKHMHNAPVEVTTKIQAPDGVEKITGREFTVYDFFGTKIFPRDKVMLEIKKPLLPADVPSYVPSGAYNQTLYKKVFTLDYDADGNLGRVQKTSDQPVTYLWGYDKRLPIAEIKNGATGGAYHTSFEEDGDTFSDGDGNVLAKTGKKARAMSAFTFPASFTPVESNTLMSYWYWQNEAWHFSGMIPFQRTITTPGNHIDEVRAWPKEAKMRTFTYDPLVGTTSATDENNVSQYFEYDLMGRLKLIRNDHKQIVKNFFYHYRK